MTTAGKLNNGDELDYACGLFIEKYRGSDVVSHSGASYGFRSEFIRFPKHRLSVLVFTNNEELNPTGIAYQVAELFLKEELKASEARLEIDEPQQIELKPAELEKFVGHYWNSEILYFV
jgi:hypothetical protein